MIWPDDWSLLEKACIADWGVRFSVRRGWNSQGIHTWGRVNNYDWLGENG
jgi:hypothetical protein